MSDLHDETSPSLLERARSDNPDAWKSLVRIYGPLVYGWSRRAGLQPSDASDVVQEVFAAVAKGLGRFRKDSPDDSFKGWVWTICRNKIRDHFRNVVDHPVGDGGTSAHLRIQGTPDLLHGGDSDSGRSDLQLIQMNALLESRALFEPNVWQAFWRVTVENRTPAEVARELGLTVWAVYKARSRVLQRLQRELEGLVLLEGPEDPRSGPE